MVFLVHLVFWYQGWLPAEPSPSGDWTKGSHRPQCHHEKKMWKKCESEKEEIVRNWWGGCVSF